VAENASATNSDGAAAYVERLAAARGDDNILAFWLGGSRGKGRETVHSDYDCAMVVRDDVLAAYSAKYATVSQGPLDCLVFTLAGLEAYGAWGSDSAWDRYSFAHVTTLVDQSGQVQGLIDAKARVPAEQLVEFIGASADHFINQVYRSAKCARDGLALASRLEAAEGVHPLLDILFALDGGRLRPFAKYLTWELETWPLADAPWSSAEILGALQRLLDGDQTALQSVLRALEPRLRAAGHGPVLDAWGPSLRWILHREL
jgi:hypothetical protein